MVQPILRAAASILAITMVALVALVMMIAASVLADEPAHAEDSRRAAAEAVRSACQADIEKLCPGVQQGGGRILQCLRGKQDQISDGCKTAMQSVRRR
jgi:Cysteine rich repeat